MDRSRRNERLINIIKYITMKFTKEHIKALIAEHEQTTKQLKGIINRYDTMHERDVSACVGSACAIPIESYSNILKDYFDE